VANERELARLADWGSIQRDYASRRDALPARERLLADLFLMHPLNPPKRLDYGRVRLFRGSPPSPSAAARYPNYAVVRGAERVTLVLREYKTSAAFGRFEQELPAPLARAVWESLRGDDREWLLQAPEGGPLGDNRLGKMLSRAMRRLTGMAVGASNLRKSFVTQLRAGGASEAEMQRAADLMLHSTAMQRTYERRNIGAAPRVPKKTAIERSIRSRTGRR
jgi:hypothetical protein